MDKVRIAFIGAGGHANSVHYPSLSEMEDVEIAAICDLDEERLKQTADKYGVTQRFTDYEKMLEEVEPDAVYIVMPPAPLVPIATEVLSQGYSVLMEKPPGVTSQETRQMLMASKKGEAKNMVAFNRRFCPLLTESRRRIEERGPVTLAVGEFHKAHWKDKMYYGYGTWLTLDVIHTFDTVLWLGGEEVEEFRANVRKIDSPAVNVATVLFSFASGACGVLHSDYVSGARVERFEIHGQGISAFIQAPNFAHIFKDGKGEPEVITGSELAGSDAGYRTYGFFQENRHFIDCLKTDKMPDTNLEYALKLMELIEKVEAEANRGMLETC